MEAAWQNFCFRDRFQVFGFVGRRNLDPVSHAVPFAEPSGAKCHLEPAKLFLAKALAVEQIGRLATARAVVRGEHPYAGRDRGNEKNGENPSLCRHPCKQGLQLLRELGELIHVLRFVLCRRFVWFDRRGAGGSIRFRLVWNSILRKLA